MSSQSYLVIKGNFVVVGKAPDGDSVRFIAHRPDLYKQLHRAYRIRPSKDGSVQLRFEGVDAPELHYGSAAQPGGKESRDYLLKEMGFRNIKFVNDRSATVKSANPDTIPGVILTQAAETNGRPVSYVLLEEQAKMLEEGEWVPLEIELLSKTLNYHLLTTGMAYYTVYTSTPLAHRQHLGKAAAVAREDERGIWQKDVTSYFKLVNSASVGPDGQLILPKLFRRCIDYMKDFEQGAFRGNLADWLIWVSKNGSRNENDAVILNDRVEVLLSDLLRQANQHVIFQADLLDITFVEK